MQHGRAAGARSHTRSPPTLGPTSLARVLLVQPKGDVRRRQRATPRLPCPVPASPSASGPSCHAGEQTAARGGGAQPEAGRAAGSGGPDGGLALARSAGAEGNLLGAHIGVLSTQDIRLHEEFQSAHDVSSLLRRTGTGAASTRGGGGLGTGRKVFSRLRRHIPASGLHPSWPAGSPGAKAPALAAATEGWNGTGTARPAAPMRAAPCPAPMVRSCLGPRDTELHFIFLCEYAQGKG